MKVEGGEKCSWQNSASESWKRCSGELGTGAQPHQVSGAAVSGNSGDWGVWSCVSTSGSGAEVLRAMREADSFQLQMKGVSSKQMGAQSVEGGVGSSRSPLF